MYPFLLHLNFIQSFDIQFIHFPSSSIHTMSRWWFLGCLLSIYRATLYTLQTLLIKQNQLALKIDEKNYHSDLKNHIISYRSCIWLISDLSQDFQLILQPCKCCQSCHNQKNYTQFHLNVKRKYSYVIMSFKKL